MYDGGDIPAEYRDAIGEYNRAVDLFLGLVLALCAIIGIPANIMALRLVN